MPPKRGGVGGVMGSFSNAIKRKESALQAEPTHTVIAFSSVEFLCWEYDDAVPLTVVRRGDASAKVNVHWKTHNESLPEMCYMAQEGVVTLDTGAREATIRITILNNEHWDIEGRIRVDLSLEEPVSLRQDIPHPSGDDVRNGAPALTNVEGRYAHMYFCRYVSKNE